jgi:hypothetical protein
MNNKGGGGGGMGVGSASIILIFAVLCLTIFSLITYVVAANDSALVDTEAQLVIGYYEADMFAERIVAEILESYGIPDVVHGVDIETYWDWDMGADLVYFLCEVSDIKSLFVRIAIYEFGSYDILTWRMVDTDEWSYDSSLNVWQPGDMIFDDEFDLWLGFDDDDDD